MLYEGGQYNYIFLSRLHRLVSTLESLIEQIEDDQKEKALELNLVGYRCYLKTKSELGDAEIQYLYGDALYNGLFGFEEDDEQASEWIFKSADQGNFEAIYKLHTWDYAGLCGLEENEPKALELLTAASEGGYLEAQLRLAGWYKDGIVVSQDPKKAFQLYKSASDAGSNEAKLELAFCYVMVGIKQNKKTAFGLVTDAAEGGSITGQRLLGVYYSHAIGTKENMDNALKWWHSAAAKDDAFSIYLIGKCYLTGDGVEKDPSQAYEWFERAVALEEHGSDDARFCRLLQYYGSGCEEDDDAAYINFSLAHEAGVERAAYYVGACNYWGQGTSKNYIKAAEHFEECAESDPDAAFYLGECHRNGTGRKKDYKQAFEWYLKSAEGEVHNAQMAIGRAFYLGEGVAEDNVEAMKWLVG